jgi:hypothetical protein
MSTLPDTEMKIRRHAPNVYVIKSDEPEDVRHFFEALGLAFQNEKHGNGPAHVSCERNGMVLEIYPDSEASPPRGTGATASKAADPFELELRAKVQVKVAAKRCPWCGERLFVPTPAERPGSAERLGVATCPTCDYDIYFNRV